MLYFLSSYCSSATKSCLTLCDRTDCSLPGFPVLHHLLALAQTHVQWVSDAIQPSHPLSSPSPYLRFKEIHLTFFIERGIGLDFIVIIIEDERQGWRGSGGKETTCQCRRHQRPGFSPLVGKIQWRRKWQPTPVFLPGESHGQRGLAGYSPWSHKELDTMEAS